MLAMFHFNIVIFFFPAILVVAKPITSDAVIGIQPWELLSKDYLDLVDDAVLTQPLPMDRLPMAYTDGNVASSPINGDQESDIPVDSLGSSMVADSGPLVDCDHDRKYTQKRSTSPGEPLSCPVNQVPAESNPARQVKPLTRKPPKTVYYNPCGNLPSNPPQNIHVTCGGPLVKEKALPNLVYVLNCLSG